MKAPGRKPPARGLFKREVIGPTDCPIMVRWTLLGSRSSIGKRTGPRAPRRADVKLLLHHFLPNADDRDVHDHPRPFVTLVLRGYYDDLRPCPDCRDSCGWVFTGTGGFGNGYQPCPTCRRSGLVVGERMRPGMIRRRRAGHRHRTRVGPRGCWTLVLMGPLRREWGFWKFGKWWPWKLYEEHFGFGMRCESPDEDEEVASVTVTGWGPVIEMDMAGQWYRDGEPVSDEQAEAYRQALGPTTAEMARSLADVAATAKRFGLSVRSDRG